MSGNSRGRRNWTLSISAAFVIAVAAAAIGSNVDGPQKKQIQRLYIQNSAGSVLFDHSKHAAAADSCVSCHHDLLGSELETECSDCHDSDMALGDFEHQELAELHQYDCSRCHAQVIEDDQASSCRSCHGASQDEEQHDSSCLQCHDEEYTEDMMEHSELLEIDDHTCLGCHNPGAVSETYHTSCTTCHLESSPERFTDAKGEVVCGACHLK